MSLAPESGFDAGIAMLAPGLTNRERNVGANVLALAPLERGIVAALGDGRVVAVPDEVRVLHTHDGAATHALVVAKGVITAGQDGAVMLHTPNGSRALREPDGEWINAIDYAASQDLIAVATGTKIELIGTHGRVGWLTDHASTVTGLAFSPDGISLAASRYDGISLWTVADAKPPEELVWKGSMVGVSWSPDGRFVAGATQDRELHVWDILIGKDYRLGGFETKVRCIDWTADGNHMVTSGADVIAAWPISGGPGAFPPREIGFAYGSRSTVVAAGGGNNQVAGAFSNGAVLIGDVASGEARIARAPSGAPVTALCWNAARDGLLYADRAGNVGLADIPI